MAEDLAAACGRLPGKRKAHQPWGPEITQSVAKASARHREGNAGERKELSREIAHDRRRLSTDEAAVKLAKTPNSSRISDRTMRFVWETGPT